MDVAEDGWTSARCRGVVDRGPVTTDAAFAAAPWLWVARSSRSEGQAEDAFMVVGGRRGIGRLNVRELVDLNKIRKYQKYISILHKFIKS